MWPKLPPRKKDPTIPSKGFSLFLAKSWHYLRTCLKFVTASWPWGFVPQVRIVLIRMTLVCTTLQPLSVIPKSIKGAPFCSHVVGTLTLVPLPGRVIAGIVKIALVQWETPIPILAFITILKLYKSLFSLKS